MPLTDFQKGIARLLDYFQDSEERVASAFGEDRNTLQAAGHELDVLLNQPGYIRA